MMEDGGMEGAKGKQITKEMGRMEGGVIKKKKRKWKGDEGEYHHVSNSKRRSSRFGVVEMLPVEGDPEAASPFAVRRRRRGDGSEGMTVTVADPMVEEEDPSRTGEEDEDEVAEAVVEAGVEEADEAE